MTEVVEYTILKTNLLRDELCDIEKADVFYYISEARIVVSLYWVVGHDLYKIKERCDKLLGSYWIDGGIVDGGIISYNCLNVEADMRNHYLNELINK